MIFGKREHFASRLLALVVCATLILGVSGCGGAAGRPSKSTATTPSIPGIENSKSATTERGTIVTSAIPRGQRFRGDGDADNPGDTDGNGDIDSEDGDSDYPVPESYKFPDKDDKSTFDYGHRASVPTEHAIAAVVRRYYAVGTTGTGVGACSLLSSSLASSVAEDYGQAGPSYLRGGKTCQGVLSLLFRHFHEELAEAITVVDVRIQGSRAQAVFSSRKMRASSISLVRQQGSWKIAQLFGQPLP